MALWYTFCGFGNFCDRLAYSVVFGYNFPSFGMLHQEKSGNPGAIFKREPMFKNRKLSRTKVQQLRLPKKKIKRGSISFFVL
jgi:hypothetical protein